MLNKKSIFNFIYAFALFGAFTSCIGILNELLNISQLFGNEVNDLYEFFGKSFWIPFAYYLVAFIVSAITTTFLILNLVNKFNPNNINTLIITACIILFALSLTLIYLFLKGSYFIQYYDYLVTYTFRSGVMSFIANMAVIILCNYINKKAKTESDKSSDLNINALQ